MDRTNVPGLLAGPLTLHRLLSLSRASVCMPITCLSGGLREISDVKHLECAGPRVEQGGAGGAQMGGEDLAERLQLRGITGERALGGGAVMTFYF